MTPNNILSAPLIDLIFDGRNKEYGAYNLRKTYELRIKKAMLITFSIVFLAVGGTALAGKSNRPVTNERIRGEVELIDLPTEKIVEPPPKQELPPEDVQVKTEKLTDLKLVEDDKVVEPPPSQDILSSAKIGFEKLAGVEDIRIASPDLSKGVNKGIIQEKVEQESDLPLPIVEIDAKYVGDWNKFLLRNLRADVPITNNAPTGRYTVVIQFVVDKEGNVSDIRALTKHGYGLEEEAIRVIKKATKWDPAIQNGYQVKAYRRQPITFDVLENY